jgi:chromosome partitioning protein
MTETLMREESPRVNIISALEPVLLGPAFGEAPSDVTYRVSQYCESFKTQKVTYLVPGSPEMFAFPSQLYQQLQTAHSGNRPQAVKALLESLRGVLDKQAADRGADSILMDTSLFYAGVHTWRGAQPTQSSFLSG